MDRTADCRFSNWVSTRPLREWATENLDSGRLETAGVRTAQARKLLQEHRERKADHSRPIWALLTLSEWLRWWEEARPELGLRVSTDRTDVPTFAG